MNGPLRLWTWLGTPVFIVSVAWTYWRQTTPDWDAAALPFRSSSTLSGTFASLLYNPKIAQRIGYTESQKRQDLKANETWVSQTKALEAKVSSLYAAGVDRYKVGTTFHREIERLSNETSPFPSLTRPQRQRLLEYSVRWAGPWLLMDRGIARRIGLSEAERRKVVEARDGILRFRSDENAAYQRLSARIRGAPERALLAMEDAHRLDWSTRTLWYGDPERKRELERLSQESVYSSNPTLIPDFEGPRYDLVVRRTVAFRREEEGRILASLTPKQRTAWQAFIDRPDEP